ncbi:MAG: hypothetical protein MZV70_06305 [Desulfobacterales bacterium]|nr:hypothetical protein [Desulfobacterales bacterium]
MADLKLSFAKLAAAQSATDARPSRPAAAAACPRRRPRRLLTPAACDYLTQVFQIGPQPQAVFAGAAVRPSSVRWPTRPRVRDALFIAALHLDDRSRFAVHHSVNVAVYAVKMAQDLGFDAERQVADRAGRAAARRRHRP